MSRAPRSDSLPTAPLRGRRVVAPMLAVLLTVPALTFNTAAIAQPTVTGTPDELRALLGLPTNAPRVVTIRGHAEATAYTDRAIVSLIVTTERRTLAEALDANAAIRDSIRRTLIDAGVDADSINNSRFSTSPQFGLFGRNPNTYQVVNRVEVKIGEEAQMTVIGTIVDENPEVGFGGTEFEHSEKDAFEDRVRKEAMDDAMEERAFYESALGVTLRPVGFRSGPVVFQPQALARRAMEEIVVTAARRDGAEPAPAQATVPTFDEVEYQADIQVDFEIVPSATDP